MKLILRQTTTATTKTTVTRRLDEVKRVKDDYVVEETSPSGSFISGGNRLGTTGFDDKKEDDWEKLSRISRRTAQHKKPVNLDTIEDKIKSLHTLQIDMGTKKPAGNFILRRRRQR